MITLLVPAIVLSVAQPQPGQLSRAHVEEDLAALQTAIRTHWSYYDLRVSSDGLDLGKAVQETLARLPDGATRDELRRELVALVAALHDGHAGVFVPDAAEPARRSVPFEVRDSADGVIVSRAAAAPPDGPRIGDRLLAIDGVPVNRAIAAAEPTVFGSTPGMRRDSALRRALQVVGDSAALELESPEGTRRTCSVPTSAQTPAELRGARAGAPPTLDWPADRVARLTIPTFTVADWEAWRKAAVHERDAFLAEGKKRIDEALDAAIAGGAQSLILDLRANAGGTDLLGIHLAQRLLDQPFTYFRLSASAAGEWMDPAGITYQPRSGGFAGPLVALIDERAFSTTDNFLRCLRDLRPAFTTVGRPTGGGTGAPGRIVTLPRSGAVITLCTQRVYGPAGTPTEGSGTVPDKPVVWTREDVISGRDPDLAAALEFLAAKP